MDFYYVDKKYINYLKSIDSKVPNVSYSSNQKFVCGIVLEISGVKYYAPISHNVNSNSNAIIIRNNSGDPIASIRFVYMIPVFDTSLLTRLDFSGILANDPKYGALLIQEHRFCESHKQEIRNMAYKVYKIGCNPNHFLHHLCCDFKSLEAAAKLWPPTT